MIVLFPHTNPSPKTIKFIEQLEDHTAATVYRVFTGNWERSYEHALKNLWKAPDDLLIIEHDIIPTMQHLNSFVDCAFRVCAAPYEVINPNRDAFGNKNFVHAQFHMSGRREIHFREIEVGDSFCDMTGFGCTYFRAPRVGIDWNQLWPHGMKPSWKNLDGVVMNQVRRHGNVRVHLHWPEVDHDHLGNEPPTRIWNSSTGGTYLKGL